MNHYETLEIKSTATEQEIKTAYRKLALKWHPDKHSTSDKHMAQKKFVAINHAYDVLMNPQKRTLYDRFGDSSDLGGTRTDEPSTTSNNHHFAFGMNDATRIFDMFFNATRGSTGTPYATAFESTDGGMGGFGLMFNDRDPLVARKDPPLQHTMRMTLEDINNGLYKKLRITQINNSKVEIPIQIDPGTLPTTLTFPEMVPPAMPNKIASDLIVILEEAPHKTFKRKGYDLEYTIHDAKLVDVLCGKVWQIPLLNGTTYDLDLRNTPVLQPPFTHTIEQKGLPMVNSPGRFGKLMVNFNIKYPQTLTDEQKQQLVQILS